MVEETARMRVTGAMKTRSMPSVQAMEYKIGDQVELYRDPKSKDASGWHGPGTICDMSAYRKGSIGVRWQGNVMSCRPGDIRPYIGFLIYLTNRVGDVGYNAMDELRCHISNLYANRPCLLLSLIHI